jgi:phosphoglycolate phosphatase
VSSALATARAVIFDCDGVLFDSWHANVAYYNAIRTRLGLPPMSAEWERRAHFLAASSVFQEMFGDDRPLLERARQVAHTIDYEPFYELMVPVPGLHEVLAHLRPSWRLGMATNRGSTVQEVVRRFGLDAWLDAAVGVLDVARPKPHPDVIEECLVRLAVLPGAAVYIGDAESDAAAAHAAGVHFVAVGELPSSERVVRDLREVPGVLDRLALEWGSSS